MQHITPGEKAFISFCREKGVSIRKIDEDDFKNPDYEIAIGAQHIIVEVKDIELNAEEKLVQQSIAEYGHPVWGTTPGSRVRSKIDKARRQLKKYKMTAHPTLIILFDTRPFPLNTLEPYDIKVAMYGFETHILKMPLPATESPEFIGKVFGKGRKFSDENNTYISAIGMLVKNFNGDHELHLYHNLYADKKIYSSSLENFKNVKQYQLNGNPSEIFCEWIKIY